MSIYKQSATSRLVGSLIGRLADRIHTRRDADAQLDGITWYTRPDGTRVAHKPNMAAIAAQYRARTLANPDPLDRMFVTGPVFAQHHDDVTRGLCRPYQQIRTTDRRSRR